MRILCTTCRCDAHAHTYYMLLRVSCMQVGSAIVTIMAMVVLPLFGTAPHSLMLCTPRVVCAACMLPSLCLHRHMHSLYTGYYWPLIAFLCYYAKRLTFGHVTSHAHRQAAHDIRMALQHTCVCVDVSPYVCSRSSDGLLCNYGSRNNVSVGACISGMPRCDVTCHGVV